MHWHHEVSNGLLLSFTSPLVRLKDLNPLLSLCILILPTIGGFKPDALPCATRKKTWRKTIGRYETIIVNDHRDGWLSGSHVTDVRDGRIRVEGEKACTVCHVTLLSDKAEMHLTSTGTCYKANNH